MNKKNYSKTVCIFGGTGFVGEAIVQKLAKKKFQAKNCYQEPLSSSKAKSLWRCWAN